MCKLPNKVEFLPGIYSSAKRVRLAQPYRFIRNYFHTLLLLFGTFVQAQSIQNDIPIIKNYTYRDYVASPQNWGMTQDQRGKMYFANDYGILDFDGNNWRLSGITDRIPPRSVAMGEGGTLYIGAFGNFGYMKADHRGTMRFTSLKNLIPEKYRDFEDVWSVYSTTEAIYFCTNTLVFKYHNNKVQVFELPGSKFSSSYFVHNRLLVHVPEQGVYELSSDQFKLIPGSEALGSYQVMAMVAAENDRVLVATRQNGLFAFDGKSTFSSWESDASRWGRKNNLNTAIATQNGYALGSVQNGVLIADKKGAFRQHLFQEKGLQSNSVQALFQGREGNLWVASNKGIDYIQLNAPFTILNSKVGLPGVGYSSLGQANQNYWATSEGLYVSSNSPVGLDEQSNSFRLVENTQGIAYTIQSIDNLLLLAHHNGPFQIVNNKAIKLSNHNGAWVFKQLESRPEYVICGTYTGLLLYKIQNGSLRFLWKINGFTESSRVIEEDKNGDIWVAHGYKGLFRLQLDQNLRSVRSTNFYNGESGFPGNFFINVFKIDNQLVFTGERGVYAFNASTNKFEPHPLFTPLFDPNGHIRKLVQSKDGTIWYSIGEQIGSLQRKPNGGYLRKMIPFKPLHGSLVAGFEYFGFPDPSKVIIGTEDGFLVFRPDQINNLTLESHSVISSVSMSDGKKNIVVYGGAPDDDSVETMSADSGNTVIDYSFNSLKFNFSTATHAKVEKTQYQFFLEGYDKSWSDWNLATSKEYTQLPVGSYTFHVRSRGANNKESTEATYEFRIAPPWYLSNWAYGIYFLAIIGLGFQGRKLLARREMRARQRILEEQQKTLRLKEAEYNESILKAEKEIIRLNSEKLSAELAHKNQELTTSATNLMNQLESNEKVRLQLDKINAKINDPEISSQLRQVIKSLQEENLHENNWEQFEMHFNQTHQDFLQRIREEYPQLAHQEIRLLAYLRMNLTSKEIASLMNLSVRSIENNRYRIRKKMNLDQSVNLLEYILRY